MPSAPPSDAPPKASPAPASDRLFEIIRRHGAESTAFQGLEPGLDTFFDGETEGVVCYAPTGGSWVAAGGPIAPPEELSGALARFTAAARAQGRKVILFCTEAATVDAARALNAQGQGQSKGMGFTWVKIGEQPAFDLKAWTLEGPARRTVRAQVNRARNRGVTLREASLEEVQTGGEVRARAQGVIDAWRDTRTMSPMGFLVDLHPFQRPEARRYFVAFQGGRLVGLLAAVPIYRRRGWFVEDLIRRPDAPNGTAESLVHLAFSTLGAEGFEFGTLGLAPLSGDRADPAERAPSGVRPWLPWLFEQCFERANRVYSFKGLRSFKEKFKPDRWEPVYVVVSPPPIGPPVVWDMLSAFIPGSRLQFALDTGVRVIRGLTRRLPLALWAGTAWALSLLLIPWIVLLLSVDPIRRFGTEWLPWAWASFDGMMALAFALLAYALGRWRRFAWSLSRVMLGAVLADVWLTASQILLFNLPSATHRIDVVVSAVAVTAPVVAAVFLGLVVVRFRPGAR